MKRVLIASAIAVGLLGAAAAFAQTYAPAYLPNFSPTLDAVQVIPNGSGSAQSQYVHPGQITGAQIYQNLGAATTGNTYTFTAGQLGMFMKPAGTLAAVTLVTEANPSDGQRECFLSTQTTTALTWNAATGQTVDNSAPSAGVANTAACLTYQKSTTTWYRSN